MQVVANKEWCFFVSKSTSLRVNLSPDFTVATLDFIMFDNKNIPRSLRFIGQPRLPICFRFCGLGTYFSPWYIDTNDMLMQSISQANEVCIFIDKAWINFIIELNLKLRKLRRYSLTGDLMVFLQQLLEDKLVGSLGGMITQFCCFLKPDKLKAGQQSPIPPPPPHDSTFQSSPELERNHFVSRPNSPFTDFPLPPPPPGDSPHSRTSPSPTTTAHKSTNSSQSQNVAQAVFDADIKNTNMLSEFASIRSSTATLGSNTMPNMPGLDSRGGGGGERDYEPDSSDRMGVRVRNMHPEFDPSSSASQEHTEAGAGAEAGADAGVSLLSALGEMRRPVGFGETCRLITNGEVFPGLIFFHESTSMGDVIDTEEDGDEENKQSTVPRDNPFSPGGGGGGQDTHTSASGTQEGSGGRDKYSEGGGRLSGRGVYGHKMDELDKFYKILANADEKNQNNSQVQSTDFHSKLHQSNSGESLYASMNDDESHNIGIKHRERTQSHNTNDSSEMSSHVSSDFIESSRKDSFRKSLNHYPSDSGRPFKISTMYQNIIQVWCWSCKSSKPMLLTADVFANCNSVSTLKLIYPATVDVVGEAISNFFRCETILRKNKYTAWEQMVKFTAMINRILSHSTNKLPRSKLFQHSMTVLFFFFIFLDIGCTCFVSLNYWCVWGDRTTCDNHTGVILMQSFWPGALIMAPLMGLRVMILNSTGSVARQYVCWSRLACFNCLMMVVIYLKWTDNAKTFLNIPVLIAYAGSRLFQIFYFDSLIATGENKRTSRGWNGLYTSITNFENHEFS